MTEQKRISFVPPVLMKNKVAAIKAIRELTDLGLKDAKDVSESSGVSHTFSLRSNISEDEINNNCRILRAEGFKVGEPVFELIEDLRKLGSQALLQGEDELANEILQLVLVEKLRRKF